MTAIYQTAIVIGGGAFGTSMAAVLCENFNEVFIKVRSLEAKNAINAGENAQYLAGHTLPANLRAICDWNEIMDSSESTIELIVSGLPTSAINSYFKDHKTRIEAYLKRGIPLVSLAKGIDPVSLELTDDLFYHHLSEYQDRICFLSGPSFAQEIVGKQVTIVSLAGKTPETLLKVSEMLQTPYFKALPTYDIKGVLLGGALKNILAIASGILEGLGYNHNTRAALITRGIIEMLRFGKVFNARPETFYGPSGMGDLILTTTGGLSRNKSFGIEVAKGRTPQSIIASSHSVVEGYKTAEAAYLLAKKYQLNVRLFDGIYHILFDNIDPKEVIKKLMELPVSSIE